MRKVLKWGSILAVVVIGAGSLRATPATGFTGKTIVVGHFGEIRVRLVSSLANPPVRGEDDELWTSIQKTRGDSDLYLQDNTWAPGGTTGWHTHPGHSLIIVTAGTVTTYEGDDPSCTPHVYPAGTSFVDPGGDHVHVIRNEGAVEAKTTAVQLIPAGAARRVDGAANFACGF